MLYNVVGTCKHLGIDPFAYLREALPGVFALGGNPAAEQLATLHRDSVVRLRDPVSGAVLRQLPEPESKVLGHLRFTPDGKGLLLYGCTAPPYRSGSNDRRALLLWDFEKDHWRVLTY